MFEYEAEIVTRSRYNFESSRFSVDDSRCFDYPNIDENGWWNIPEDLFIPISIGMTSIQIWDAIASQMW